MALAESSPEKVAAVGVAAEAWAMSGDHLKDDHRREVEVGRLEHKRLDDEEYAARGHRRCWLPTLDRRADGLG